MRTLALILLLIAGATAHAATSIASLGPVGMPQAGGGGGTSPGTTNLRAWFDFDDATDAHSTFDLAPTGTPTFAGGVGSITTGSSWLQASIDDAWGNASGDTSMVIRWRAPSGLSNGNYIILNNNGRFGVRWLTAAITGIGANITASFSTTPAANTWYTCIVTHEATSGETILYVNAETPVTATGTASFGTGAVLISSTADVTVDYDFLAFYNRLLTADERTWFYNAGATRTYADL